MRVLGLDVGDRRVGLAVSDETGTLAHGRGVYLRQDLETDVEALSQVAQEAGAQALVVGLPLNMNGSEGPQAAKVRQLAQALAEKTGLAVHYVDERWTTQEVERMLREVQAPKGKKRRVKDEMSAVLILQAWLDRQRGV